MSQGKKEKFARTFRKKTSCKRDVLWCFGIRGGVLGPLNPKIESVSASAFSNSVRKFERCKRNQSATAAGV